MEPLLGMGSAGDFSGNLELQLEREWIAVNHLGGYASSTVPGLNTRKYHGLLVAAMAPPVSRMVLLSRVEETIICDGWSSPLACNEYPNSFHPRGDQSLRAFSADPFPRWAYQGHRWTIEKSLQLIDGQNTVLLSYSLLGGADAAGIELQLRPLLALRSIHDLMYQWNGPFQMREGLPGHHHIPATGQTPEVFFAHDGNFEIDPHWYLSTIYRREQDRGYAGLEDLWNPGMVRWSLKPGQTVHFACSADAIDLELTIKAAERQSRPTMAAFPNTYIDAAAKKDLDLLINAADQFVLNVPRIDHKRRVYVAANYPWSPPSPRQGLISFAGLFLVPGKLDEARTFLIALAGELNSGVLPSALAENGGPPLFRGVDTSLWFINAVHEYFKATNDLATIRTTLFDAVSSILHWYREGTMLGIVADVDGLLLTNQPGIPTTWMDAQADGWVVTPRGGKAVEVNALWYNALRIGAELASRVDRPEQAVELNQAAAMAQGSFNRRFWNDATNCCYDVLDDLGADPSVRPNQLLAISLPYPVLSPAKFDAVLEKVRNELLTPLGLRTLSPLDPSYVPRYAGNVVQRERAHHQGSVFPWLLGPYISAYLRLHGHGEGARAEARSLLQGCLQHMTGNGMGQLCELFDGAAPHRPGGAIASAASVAELLRVLAIELLRLGWPPPRNAPHMESISPQNHPQPSER